MAVTEFKNSLAIFGRVAADNPYIGFVLNELATTYAEMGEVSKAQKISEQCINLVERTVGIAHPRAVIAVRLQGQLLYRLGRKTDAEKLFEEALATCRNRFGNDHINVAKMLAYLADVEDEFGDPDKAERFCKEAFKIYSNATSEATFSQARMLYTIGVLLKRRGKFADAEEPLRKAVAIVREASNQKHNLAQVTYNLGDTLLSQRKYAEAGPYLAESLQLSRETTSSPDLLILCLEQLARWNSAKGEHQAAKELRAEALALSRKRYSKDVAKIVSQLETLAQTELACNEPQKATEHFQEALDLTSAKLQPKARQRALQIRCLTLARLAGGDGDGYRDGCARLIKVAEEANEPDIDFFAATTAVLAPNAVAEPAHTLVPRAEKVSRPQGPKDLPRPWHGAALYRAHQYEEAVRRLKEAELDNSRNHRPFAWLFLAMSHHQLGHADEAGSYLDRATKWLEAELNPNASDPYRAAGLNWDERLEMQLLLAEATSLIKK